jgi:hypothetical protein
MTSRNGPPPVVRSASWVCVQSSLRRSGCHCRRVLGKRLPTEACNRVDTRLPGKPVLPNDSSHEAALRAYANLVQNIMVRSHRRDRRTSTSRTLVTSAMQHVPHAHLPLLDARHGDGALPPCTAQPTHDPGRPSRDVCRRLEREGEALWLFLDVQGVEATNNIAEVRFVDQKPALNKVWGIGPARKSSDAREFENLIPVSV